MNRFVTYLKWIWAVALMITVFHATEQQANAAGYRSLSSVSPGEVVSFAGKEWVVLDPAAGYVIARNVEGYRTFGGPVFDPSNSNNIAYWLNNDFYNSLPSKAKEWIASKNWTTGVRSNESASSVSAKIGMISFQDIFNYKTYITSNKTFWTRTPYDTYGHISLFNDIAIVSVESWENYPVRPALYLISGLFVSPEGLVVEPFELTSPVDDQQVSPKVTGFNGITIAGTVIGDQGITLTVKYTIDGVSTHQDQTIQALVANGEMQSFDKTITVDDSWPRGTYTLRVWYEDPDGKKSKEITRTFRIVSSNADLSALTVDGAGVAGFAPEKVAYTVKVPNATTAVLVAGTPADANAVVSVTGGQSLNVGDNTVTVRVTAEDAANTKVYTLTVRRLARDADLSALTVDGAGVAGFAPDTLAYTWTVPNATTAVAVAGTPADANAVVSVTGGQSLNVGDNTVTVRVTAEDATITEDYTITVNRAGSSNADLTGLSLSEGTLHPGFTPATISYTASVGYSVTSLTVTPTVDEATATVKVNDESVASGQASSPIKLKTGSNTITVRVTAQDHSTKTYSIQVSRQSYVPTYYPVTGVSLDQAELALTAGGETATLRATIEPAYATVQSVSWSSSKPEVAAIDQNGVVTPLKEGEAIVTVTAQDGSFTAQSRVTVEAGTKPEPEPEPEPEPVITLSGLKASQESVLLKPGEQTAFKVYAVYSDGKRKNITSDKKTSYRSSLQSRAAVKPGIIKAGQRKGDATIAVRYQDQRLEIPVTVSDESVEKLQLSREQAQMEIGEELQLKAAAHWSDGTQKDVTKQAAWVSDQPDIVAVEDGELIAFGEGEATITVYYGGHSAEMAVKATEAKEVKRITANKRTVTLKAGKTQEIKLYAYYKSGRTALVSKKAEWETADESIATVKDGTITAVGTGVTTVTATYGGRTLTIRVMVRER